MYNWDNRAQDNNSIEAGILLEVARIALEGRKCLIEGDGHTENTQIQG